MKKALLITALFLINQAQAEEHACKCKCVSKDSDGKYSVIKGGGKNRTEAGEDLKKNLGKQKCEISPDCSGKC